MPCLLRLGRVLAPALIVATMNACGGGGGSGSISQPPTPTPTPLPPNTTQGILSTGGAQIALPSFAGYSGTITAPSPSSGAGTQITIVLQTGAPTGLPVLQDGLRQILSVNSPVVYLSITPSATVSFTSSLGFTINLPQPPLSGVLYYMAVYDPTNLPPNWTLNALGPATVSGSTLSLMTSSSLVSLIGNVTYWFALYYTSDSAVVLNPSSLAFLATGSAYAQTFTASQAGYTGPFTVSGGTCGSYASVTPAQGASFSVTPNAPGTCNLTVSGANGFSTQLSITVTVTVGGGS
jgi:hypothetical protein